MKFFFLLVAAKILLVAIKILLVAMKHRADNTYDKTEKALLQTDEAELSYRIMYYSYLLNQESE
jgi:hypothetical protein